VKVGTWPARPESNCLLTSDEFEILPMIEPHWIAYSIFYVSLIKIVVDFPLSVCLTAANPEPTKGF
jgi:hypothetical protein